MLLKRLLARGAEASDADWHNCAHVLREHAAFLQSIDEEHQALARQTMAVNARQARQANGGPSASGMPGAMPTRESVEASKTRATEALLDRCLKQMEQRLSAKGWHDFQEMLKQRVAGQQRYRTMSPSGPG